MINKSFELKCKNKCDECDGGEKPSHHQDCKKCKDQRFIWSIIRFHWGTLFGEKLWTCKEKQLFLRFELDQEEPTVSIIEWSEQGEHPNVTQQIGAHTLTKVALENCSICEPKGYGDICEDKVEMFSNFSWTFQ